MIRVFIILIFLTSAIPCLGQTGYLKAEGPYVWSFPRDHGSHPEFQSEWWYFTGHLKAEDATFGFELTTFRFSREKTKNISSRWDADQFFLTHFTITDERNKRFHVYELANRGSFGLAGAEENRLNVWNGPYRIEQVGSNFRIVAKSGESELRLDLSGTAKIVLNGISGLSRKGPERGNASYYYSVPGLTGSGTLKIKGATHNIKSASVWMDREFFTIENPFISNKVSNNRKAFFFLKPPVGVIIVTF